MISTPPELWATHGELNDMRNTELLSHKHDGSVVNYEQLLAESSGKFADQCTLEAHQEQYDRLQKGARTLAKIIDEVKPDVAVIVSDDQNELFFEDNMPMFSVFWGETFHLLPRPVSAGAPTPSGTSTWGYGDKEMDVPVDSELGKHIIESLVDAEFDVAHYRYLNSEYGGSIGPAGYLQKAHVTKPRPFGLPHGFGFVVRRLMNNNPIPMVPISQNTCYPPNQPTPKRCYSFGAALRQAIESWDSDKRVAVFASGGLSHFVLDEELDRLAIKGMQEKNAEILCSLPRQRLQSATSEILDWVTAAGSMEHLDFNLVDYVAAPRTPAGTGGGWAFGYWS
jgi:hypothetical protein